MDILISAINIFVILIIFFAFFNIKISVTLYISYLILVPYLELNIGGQMLSHNLVNTILLLAFLIHFRSKKFSKVNFKLINPFLFLFFTLLILSIFATATPFNIQINSWRITFMKTCILVFLIWNISRYDNSLLIYIKWALIISIIIAGIYALILTQFGGINIYTSYLADYYDKDDVASIYSKVAQSRLSFSTAGKIQATMIHPMTWTFVLCMSFVVFFYHFLKTNNKYYLIFIVFIAFNILISGVRTGIAALGIGYFYFLFQYRKKKIIIISLSVFVILGIIVQSNEDLSELFGTFTEVSSNSRNNISGSSITMRLSQLQGTFEIIQDSPIVGNGYGWNGLYLSKYGDHPILLAFESIVFVVLCNHGILGVIIWNFFFLSLFRLHRKLLNSKTDIYILDNLVIVYLTYAIGTGEYGYLAIFGFFYAYLFSILYSKKTHNFNLSPN